MRKKSQRKFLLASMKSLTNCENLSSNPLRCYETGVWPCKMLTGARLYNYTDFSCIQWDVDIGENRPMTEREAATEIIMELAHVQKSTDWINRPSKKYSSVDPNILSPLNKQFEDKTRMGKAKNVKCDELSSQNYIHYTVNRSRSSCPAVRPVPKTKVKKFRD